MKKDILKTTYPTLKIVKEGNFKNVKEELDLLGIKYNDEELLAAYSVAIEASSLEEALKLIDSTDNSLVSRATEKIDEEIQSKNKKDAQRKKAKQDKAEKDKADQLQKKQLRDHAEASNFLYSIGDYKVVGAKSHYELQSDVKREMKNGWVPYGGLSTYNPGGKLGGVPSSFFQSMIKIK